MALRGAVVYNLGMHRQHAPTLRLAGLLLASGLLLAACRAQPPPPTPRPTPTPAPPASISGSFEPAGEGGEVAGRRVALCRAIGPARQLPFGCELLPEVETSDNGGRFRFDDLTPGTYLVLFDSGSGDFAAAVGRWAGRTIRPGDWPWLRDNLIQPEADGYVPVHRPTGLDPEARLNLAAYGLQTLMIGDSPFIMAHQINEEDGHASAHLITVEAVGGEVVGVSVPAYRPAPIVYDEMREAVGPLSRDEIAALDRALSARWQRFLAGDDSAYRETDRRAIEAVRGGAVHPIGNAYFTAVETYGDELVKSTGYISIDVQSGASFVVGWLDEASGDVIEARTGYRLNVRDHPGVWIEEGRHGERYYHYGFSYYRRWGQILPDPIIALIEDFYSAGVAHVSRHLSEYLEAATSFGHDMHGVDWLPGTLAEMAAWQPSTPPFVHLPDSGTVDVRRERFLDAVIQGRVTVDRDSVDAYLRSDVARRGSFNRRPDRQEVIDALLVPYRSGHLFSDLEAAVILDATYGGDDEPLTIVISAGLEQGFHVPRYRDKEIYVSPDEVANVLLGYPGALNSRWAHEMGHIVDFRAEQYTFTSPPPVGSRCEPVKYLMEFMWWVQRYPGDAPDWDWMPINSGLTLSRLLTEHFHNSGC